MRISDWSSDVCSSDLHLALGVGLEEGGGARLAVGRHALEDLVAVIERRGHQIGRLVRRIAEHDPLVARALILVAAFVDALRDMRRLAVEIILEAEALPVKARLFVTDLAHRVDRKSTRLNSSH